MHFIDVGEHLDNIPEYRVQPKNIKKPELLDVVALLYDFKEHGLSRGEVGTVVELLDKGNAYEVEFSDENGQAYCMAAFVATDLLVLLHKKTGNKQNETETA